MRLKHVLVATMIVSSSVLLTSCIATDKTSYHMENDYQLGYDEGNEAVAEITQNQTVEDNSKKDNNTDEPEVSEDNAITEPSNNSNNSNSSMVQTQPDVQISEQNNTDDITIPDIETIINTMKASAPVIDTKTLKANEGTIYESDVLFQPGEHIGECNGIQVDTMLVLSDDAYDSKYYPVTDDLKNVEQTLQNAYGKTWLELGYTNCVPAILYDSRQKQFDENPYDMVHPGWQHTYAVLYSCVWVDGTTRYGVYYVRVNNNTDQEMMAILCPIECVIDGLNML